MIVMDASRSDTFRGRAIVTAHPISTSGRGQGPAELLDFARRIGLRPDGIQHARTHREHFELRGGRCAAAERAGALVDRRALRAALSEKKHMHLGQIGLFTPSPSSWTTHPSGSPSSPTRWVVCPARATGSVDADDIALDGWLDVARAMQTCERREVCLYEVEEDGASALRRRLGIDGRVS